MKNGTFTTQTLNSHLEYDWRIRRKLLFTDDGKTIPFRHSLGLGPFGHQKYSLYLVYSSMLSLVKEFFYRNF